MIRLSRVLGASAAVIAITIALALSQFGLPQATSSPAPTAAPMEAGTVLSPSDPDYQVCWTPLQEHMTLGPAMAIGEVESKELREDVSSPGVPRLPFGKLNGEWVILKAKIRPGDTLHYYSTEASGGITLIRGGCVVAEVMQWASTK